MVDFVLITHGADLAHLRPEAEALVKSINELHGVFDKPTIGQHLFQILPDNIVPKALKEMVLIGQQDISAIVTVCPIVPPKVLDQKLMGELCALALLTCAIRIDQRLFDDRHEAVVAEGLLRHPFRDVDGLDPARLATLGQIKFNKTFPDILSGADRLRVVVGVSHHITTVPLHR